MKNYIDAASFRDMLLCADAALSENVLLINELNVFPVPDGDTGTNMSLTMNTAAAELRKRSFESVDAAADCAASALLRGARGNSGVILSLLFRGIAKRLKGQRAAGPVDFARAMADGVDAAYKAVMKPAEGTILTVSRLAAEEAVKAASIGGEMDACLECALRAAEDALANTVNQNPVLKKAGVVDAGGKGYVVILDAMLACFRGEAKASGEAAAPAAAPTAFDKFETEDITFAFDTVFVVRKAAPDINLTPFREYLSRIGDSLVIGEDDESFKVHVHTNTPGNALNESAKYGTLELCKIENMRLQHDDLLAGRKARSTDDLEAVENELEAPPVKGAEPEKEFGIVTVCAGEGMTALFSELGADRIVTGGQTMNPSTDDILHEIENTPASKVFVFPNNKNIIMAAEQCIPLSDKKVIVMPSRTVPQGISALLNFSPDASEEENSGAMKAAMENVHTALITYAARDSDFDGHAIHAGEYLALLDGALLGSYTNIRTLFSELSWSLDEISHDFITVYYGSDVTQGEADEAAALITGCFPESEVSVVSGGQPVYYYMIALE